MYLGKKKTLACQKEELFAEQTRPAIHLARCSAIIIMPNAISLLLARPQQTLVWLL